jgi:hypothetical protein
MKFTSHTRTLAALTLAAITFSGCSNSAPGAANVASNIATSSRATESPSAEAKTPLTVYLDSLYGLSGSPQEQQQQRAAKKTKQEQHVAICMKHAGFDYTPVPSTETATGQVGPSQQDLDSKDWVSKYGYGLIETPEGNTSDQNAAGTAKAGGTITKSNDPNRAYVESLTRSEKAAYDVAMFGQSVDQGADHLNQIDDWQKMGCWGAAVHEVGLGQDPLKTAAGKAVNTAIADFQNGWASWPGMQQLEAAWASCMSGKGYAGYNRQTDAAAEIGTLITAARNAAGAGKQPADLTSLAGKERKVAMVDLNCRVQTDFRSTYKAITVAAETKFMKDNAPALDALKAAMEQAGVR